tara:strand:- start:6105 stop:7871 length:1767 start_codon:yes stop_codon:yes gene_type:complete
MFSLYYKKNNNNLLFSELENNGFSEIQNYIPIYSEFFELSKNNYNQINLNSKYSISTIEDTHDSNFFLINVEDKNKENLKKISFFKYSPLLNPLKFLTGKYKKINKNSKLNPTLNCEYSDKDSHLKKIYDSNNTSYVDGFFSFLSSKLLNHHAFTFGNDYYGSFLGIQKEFNTNVFDDLDYLHQSEFFHKNKGEMFKMDNFDASLLDDDTRKYREKIIMEDSNEPLSIDEIDNDSFDNVFELTVENLEKLNEIDLNNNIVYQKLKNKSNSDVSSNTDTSSNISEVLSEYDSDTTDSDNTDSDSDNDDDTSDDNDETIISCSNSDISEYSSSMDENINCVIYNFPVQIICMEHMHETLDSYIETNEMSDLEWKSCLIQILFILTTYQKCFDFTHNDLHTNNIMYVKTEKQHIYVKYDSQYYKIPTFGKIFKIIDFGRAIYKFKGKQLCCDSYNFKEDAANQYNFEPYKNPNKPEILPNKSFDLCRLGCSLYDYFVDDFRDENNEENEIVKLMIKWTRDDKNQNILYKKNGHERYPDFKLYKMIARTVHHCEPHNELNNSMFSCFKISKKKIQKRKLKNVINIDDIPCYV